MFRGLVQFGVLVVLILIQSMSAQAHDTGQLALRSANCQAGLEGKKASDTWAKKILVFDTNVIFNDPNSIYRFPGATIVIPGAVMTEVERHKSDEKLGRAARQFIRTLREYIAGGGQTKTGVDLGNGSILKVDSKDYSILLEGTSYDRKEHDNQILATAINYTYDSASDTDTLLVTDDGALIVKANGEEIPTMGLDYQLPVPTRSEEALPANFVAHKVDDSVLAQFIANGFVKKPEGLEVKPNQFVMLSTETVEGSITTLARYFYDRENPELSGLKKLADFSHLPIQPKNMEQAMLLDVLMDPTIHMVISQSPAGTGKTFLAIVAGLLQLSDKETYDQVMVTRTLVQIGRTELGAMPGGMGEKLGHWMPNIDDAFEALSKTAKAKKEAERAQKTAAYNRGERMSQVAQPRLTHAERKEAKRERRRIEREALARGEQPPPRNGAGVGTLPNKDKIHLVAFPHLRGRSISDSFLILDEAQNTSVHEIKTFLTRAGEGTKMVILGDATQIDSPFLNERNNGLSVSTGLFTAHDMSDVDRSLVAHVELTEGVRSQLADLARRLFDKLQNPQH